MDVGMAPPFRAPRLACEQVSTWRRADPCWIPGQLITGHRRAAQAVLRNPDQQRQWQPTRWGGYDQELARWQV
jgi:hypothetical protein